MVEEHLRLSTMTPAQASKLRGLLTWADRGFTGRPCRGALVALTARQYWERAAGHVVTPKFAEALRYLRGALRFFPPRIIQLSPQVEQQLLLYTDAAILPSGLHLGILLVELGLPAACSVFDVTQ